MRHLALLAALALAACTDKSTDDSSSADDSGGDDSAAPTTATVARTYQDFLSADPVVGASVSLSDGYLFVTDAAGLVSYEREAGARYWERAAATGYPDHVYWRGALAAGYTYSSTENMVSSDSLVLLGNVLGLTLDSARGIVVVQLMGLEVTDGDPDVTGPLVGASAELSVAYDAVLVEASGPVPFTTGSTITDDATRGLIVFVNVEPGSVEVTLTTPAGESCATDLASGDSFTDIEAGAGAFAQVNYYCD